MFEIFPYKNVLDGESSFFCRKLWTRLNLVRIKTNPLSKKKASILQEIVKTILKNVFPSLRGIRWHS